MSEAENTTIGADTRQDRQSVQREAVDFVKLVVWFLVVFILLRTYVLEGYEVQGDSMNPNLVNSERILVLKLPHLLSQFGPFRSWQAIEPGDVVVFDSPDNPNKRYVKRVIAVGPKARASSTAAAAESGAGERHAGGAVHVEFDHGRVYVDNHLIEEGYLNPEAKHSGDAQTLDLGPGEYYVLGDNRPVSKDSRSFEEIHDKQIIGKAVIRFWPPQSISLLK